MPRFASGKFLAIASNKVTTCALPRKESRQKFSKSSREGERNITKKCEARALKIKT